MNSLRTHRLASLQTFLWRRRKSRELWAMLGQMLADVPTDQIEMAITTCYVEHVGRYADWSKRSHDAYQESAVTHHDDLRQFVEWERQRQIYALTAERFAAIHNRKDCDCCWHYASELANKIEEASRKAEYNGYPLDVLLREIR